MKATGADVRPRFRFEASLAEGLVRLSRASQVLFPTRPKVTEASRTLDRRMALPLAQAGFYEPKAGRAESRVDGSGRQGELENFIPFSLQRGDGAEFGYGNGNLIAQGSMRAEEVVVSDEEGSQGEGAILGGEAAGGSDVVLVSAVEAFNELFKRAELS